MGKRITIQDIADSLGVSRNTVSKALNNTGILAESTREKILLKAAELGYKQFLYPRQSPAASPVEVREIALFTQNMPGASHFGSVMLNSFQEKISLNHYKLSIFLLREQEIRSCCLPNGFEAQKYDGILCVELFDPAYTEMLSALDLAVLFVDSAPGINFSDYRADFLLMENRSSVSHLTEHLIRLGCRSLAFAGNIRNCQSFYERYLGFMDGMKAHGVSPCTALLEARDAFVSTEATMLCIRSLDALPDAFVCANDFVAIDLIKALRKCSFDVPKDVLVTGFDDSPESKIVEPHLTTVRIPSSDIGIIAADLLLSRIGNPELSYRTTYVRTTPKFRESTRKLTF